MLEVAVQQGQELVCAQVFVRKPTAAITIDLQIEESGGDEQAVSLMSRFACHGFDFSNLFAANFDPKMLASLVMMRVKNQGEIRNLKSGISNPRYEPIT